MQPSGEVSQSKQQETIWMGSPQLRCLAPTLAPATTSRQLPRCKQRGS